MYWYILCFKSPPKAQKKRQQRSPFVLGLPPKEDGLLFQQSLNSSILNIHKYCFPIRLRYIREQCCISILWKIYCVLQTECKLFVYCIVYTPELCTKMPQLSFCGCSLGNLRFPLNPDDCRYCKDDELHRLGEHDGTTNDKIRPLNKWLEKDNIYHLTIRVCSNRCFKTNIMVAQFMLL